jgi:hypothetical protein
MDRALRNVNDVAAVTSNRESGYPDLNNVQLAQEVQKLNGYNHFSSSTANLLEEVVRRLICSQGVEVNFSGGCQSSGSLDPLDQPVSFGSTLTMRDIATAPFSVILDPREHLKKSQVPGLVKQLVTQGFKEDVAEGCLDALKKCYNLKAISQQAPANFDVVFYWLKNGALYWTWTDAKNTPKVE